MKITLSKGFFAEIDDTDFEEINSFKWYLGHDGYAVRDITKSDGRGGHVLMHHAILGRPPKNLVTDHINGNKIDNRRSNLRFVTRQQNQFNRHTDRGVSFMGTKWEAYIWLNRKKIYLGLFETRKAALKVRKMAEHNYYGDFVQSGKVLTI